MSSPGGLRRLHPTRIVTDAHPGTVVVEPTTRLPRYWLIAWQLYRSGRAPAASTENLLLLHIDKLYLHCDAAFGIGSLDAALGNNDDDQLYSMVETFHSSLVVNYKEITTATKQRWAAARAFLIDTLNHRARNAAKRTAIHNYLAATESIEVPYRTGIQFARALPDITLNELLDVAQPTSARNPYLADHVRWRNWLLVLLLLRAGLRRGEALLLMVDSLKHGVDRKTGGFRYWLNVTTLHEDDADYELDRRHTKPGIKTKQSHRQVPIDEELAECWSDYVAMRPSGETNYLFTARGTAGLSKEAVDRVLQRFSGLLSAEARSSFSQRSGGKTYVSSHDFRHTCACIAYHSFMAGTKDRELAFQRMRAFFGWDKRSEMPEHYAHAAIEDDLLRTWNATFAQQVVAARRFYEDIS